MTQRKTSPKKLHFFQLALSKCDCGVKTGRWRVWGIYEYINGKKYKIINTCNECVGTNTFKQWMRQLSRAIEFEVHAPGYFQADPILAKLTAIEKELQEAPDGKKA